MMKKMYQKVVSFVLAMVLVVCMLPPVTVYASPGFRTEPMIAAGNDHTVALRSDGTVWAWGSGSLGNGAFSQRQTTPILVENLNNIVAISSGCNHILALHSNGTVWAWGRNNNGQLGDGTTVWHNTPTQIPGLDNVIAITGGRQYSVALRNDGTVWAWGDNRYGNLGDGTTSNRSVPVQVQNLNNVTAIAAGSNHTVAVRSDGTVWVWGANGFGLGDGHNSSSNIPVQVQNINNAVAVDAEINRTMVLRSDGTVWAWGNGAYGRLGDGTTESRSIPVQVQNLNNVVAIAAGGFHHAIALRDDGTVWAWGGNQNGQLGDGTTMNRLLPMQVQGITNITAIAAGHTHTVSLRDDGTIRAWGDNSRGQIGDGTANNHSTPTQVVGQNGVGHLNLDAGATQPPPQEQLPQEPPPQQPATTLPPYHHMLMEAGYYRWTSNPDGTPIRHYFYQEHDIIRREQVGTRIFVEHHIVNTRGNRWYRASYMPGLGHGTFWIYSGNLARYGPGTSRIFMEDSLAESDERFHLVGQKTRITATIEFASELGRNADGTTDTGIIEATLRGMSWDVCSDSAIAFGESRWVSISRPNRVTIQKYIVPQRVGGFTVTATLPDGASASALVGVWNTGWDATRHMAAWHYSTTIPFYFHSGTAAERTAMLTAMRNWNDRTIITFEEQTGTNPVRVINSDDPAFSRYFEFRDYIGVWIGQDWPQPFRFGPTNTHFRIHMHRNVIDSLTRWYMRPRFANRYDTFSAVFAHELGHAVGLCHPDSLPGISGTRDSIMFSGLTDASVHGPTAFDIESVNMLWPPMLVLPSGTAVASADTYGDVSVITRVSASYPHYDSIDHLSEHATDIVRVEVLDERVQRLNTWLEAPPAGIDPYEIYTVYRIRVVEAFQGNVSPGDIMEVRQMGGQHGGV